MFGFGASKSKASSQSSSESFSSSFDNLDQFGFGFQSDRSVSGGESVSGSSDVSRSSSRVAFEDVFAKLFGGATGAAAGIDTGSITGAANLLFGSGRDFLSGLEGSPELEGRFREVDTVADSEIALLESDIGRFLSETVNPNITQSGVQAGTLGGSRGEVQRGIASEAALSEFVRGVTSIRSGAQGRKDALAGQIAGDRLGRSSTALSALPALFGLAESGAFGSLSPFAALAQILGPQTVLTDAQSVGSSFGSSSQFSESAGFGLNLDTTTGRAGSESASKSQSTSKSSSKSFNISGL